MTEPQISPLARRLAEENSIDWRVIPGTGPESRVIERDILTYLARIMSGEIDPPALPDASEPPAPGGSAPDLSNVSNLSAASAGMAREGIDLSSLLGGVTPATSSLAIPSFAEPAPVVLNPVAPTPAIPDPIQAAPVGFQSSSSDALPSSPLDFTFSHEPLEPRTASESAALEQISFGDPTPAPIPAAFQAPMLFSDPTPSAPPVKLASSDSVDAEFEIDLDDFDDIPAALYASAPEGSAPEISAPEASFSQISGSQLSADESPAFALPTELTSDDLPFNAPQADLTAHQADLVIDIDSTSEAPITLAAMDASNEIDDNLVLADVTTEFLSLEQAAPMALEQVQLESLQLESVQLESVQLESVQLESVQLESLQPPPSDSAALSDPIAHDDFEFDLIDTEALPAELTTPAVPASEPVEVVALSDSLEPMDSPESASPEPMLPEPTPPEPIATTAALVTPAEQPSTAVASSTVVDGFFQGFAVRRHFDASALTKIQHELTQALNGREVPLEVFLARAAQRNLHALGIGDVVTLARLGDTLEPLQASGLHHSFIEAVQSVARATPGTMQGLLILDASSLGADDLVLPASQPVLTLNVKGEYGHLALAGDLPMSKAAEFLGKVAQALEIPVSLVI